MFVRRSWREEVLRHVAAATECGLEFLEHQEDFAVITAGLLSRLDEYRPNLSAVLAGGQICSRAVVRVIKTEAGWIRSEGNSPLAVSRDERCTFFRCAIHIGWDFLTMPM